MPNRSATSLQIFRSHIHARSDGTLNVDDIISRQCYLEWLGHKSDCEVEQTKFRRTLLNHLSGVDGRTPFTSEEEAAILVLFRKKQHWPCFPHSSAAPRRFWSKGFHEKQQQALAVATAPPERDLSMDNLEHIFKLLSTKDAAYVQNLGRNVVQNYATPAFGLEDWRVINQVLRFMVLGKTTRCMLAAGKCELEARAKQLCDYFSTDRSAVAMVFDQAAQVYVERTLQQNELSHVEFGQLVGNPKATIVHGSELFRVVMAVGAAFHKPGNCMGVFAQQTVCKHGVLRKFDLFYYVDPQSLLLVIFGRACV